MKKFPENFLWGAATSAPQSEGAALSYGKTANTWDKWFELNPELFNANQGPSITSDVYHQYQDEVKRMKEIGMNSYRTSISWTRLLPDGKTLNQEAVVFYRAYFQAMLDEGIEPIMNLFHFDMPWWLMEKGGWEVRESVEHFAFYAKTAFEQFGDLVKKWATFNEPMVHVECGYLHGCHYPAKDDFKLAVQVAYHTLMAHVRAVEEFRKLAIKDGQIGIILNVSPAYPRSNSPEDLKAKEIADNLNIFSFLDPAVLGAVPEKLKEILAENQLLPFVEAKDKELIKNNPVDFVGMNYYQPFRVKAPENPMKPAKSPVDLFNSYIWPKRRMNEYRGWEIYPEALYDVAMLMKEKYHNIPWYVSENGMGVAEEERFMDENGIIQDDYRIDFMKEHLEQLHKGIKEGSNCFGYHTWTFSDCWSWLNGYRNRYGFYRVDIENDCKRVIKKSGYWYKELAENNGF
ncbi:MAG: glycoside hydrolase family 1 protein [Streptococcaceae bacterium]|nr:glycoside hydrolase family 1 protein [Streptococcaceae bacterium]